MYFTGFADEAGQGIDVQIKATKELGWSNIESRNINGINIHEITDAQFEEVIEKLEESGVKINCFGSRVANWSKDPRSEQDFQSSIKELERALVRMQRLGTKLIRGMSFAIVKDEAPDSPKISKMVFEKVAHLVKMCEDAGVIYLQENCMNYGGLSYEHTLRLLDNVKSDNFKLVYDTGNPIMSFDNRGGKPYKLQNSWEFYSNVKEFIEYVHIKDGFFVEETEGVFNKANFVFPGEGDGCVREIVADLIKNGYEGGFSMEPHMAVVLHEESGETQEDAKYSTYVEYGKRFMKLIDEVS